MKNLKPIARIGRDNHLDNLVARLPVLSFLYGLQCLFIYYMIKEIDIGNFALYLAISLIAFVLSMFVYDKYNHVILYSDHILLYFEPLNIKKEIPYEDIKDIITPKEEMPFSSIFIKLKNDEYISLHFIDYPLQVKKVIFELKHLHEEESFPEAA